MFVLVNPNIRGMLWKLYYLQRALRAIQDVEPFLKCIEIYFETDLSNIYNMQRLFFSLGQYP